MKLNLQIEGKEQIETFISLLHLGILTAMKQESMTTEQATRGLHNPYSCIQLDKLGVQKEIISLLETGCELEDIQDLLPETFPSAIDDAIEETMLVLQSNTTDVRFTKWIEEIKSRNS